ncbi:MAG: NAD(P)H-hydrate epimerase [Candidatus Heimdallarchaeota archaeon]
MITTEQMQKVDRLTVEVYGTQIIQMMENAGRNLAELIRRLTENSVIGKHVVIAVGKGNNGGGGLVTARHLYNWGANVTILLPNEPLHGIPEAQRRIIGKLPLVRKTGESAYRYLSYFKGQMIIDALIGYGLSGRPHRWIFEMIKAINATNVPVIALDMPSGLDATTGEIYKPCIQASATMTLALPKKGLLEQKARNIVGSLYLADIGVPNVLYKELSIDVESVFIHDTIIKVHNFQGEMHS